MAAAVTLPALLFGIIVLGQYARDQIAPRSRYKLAFADINCSPPAGMSKEHFLGEVQYTAELPDYLNILDPLLPEKLADAFARHSWVAKVIRVTIDPPRRVHIEMVYRTAVLAVRWQGELRAVDGDGVLLPAAAATEGLPVYLGMATAPAGPTGTRWGDPDIEAAARQAASHY